MGVQAGLVAPVVDRLPPWVAERITPVDALGWVDFEDQRLLGSQFPAADYRPVLRGRADRSAIDRRQEAVGWRRPAELEKELQVVVDEVAERDQLSRHRDVGFDGDGVLPQPGRRAVRCAVTTAPRCSSRRRSVAPSTWDDRPQCASNFRRAPRRTGRPRSSRRRPPQVRRPIHLRSRRSRSSSVVRHSGRCRGCRTIGSSRRRASWRGCKCSPGTPFPMSRCRRWWRAGHTGPDPDRTATPRRYRRSAAPADAASPLHDRPDFDSPGRIQRPGLLPRAGPADTTRPAAGPCRRCQVCRLTTPPQS